jgi:hypothetical protein
MRLASQAPWPVPVMVNNAVETEPHISLVAQLMHFHRFNVSDVIDGKLDSLIAELKHTLTARTNDDMSV